MTNPVPGREPAFKIHNFRYVILGLLFLETILNFTDLQTLAVLAPILKGREGLLMTDADYAQVNLCFQVAFVLMFLLGGWIVDRIGSRWAMALAVAWWSAAEILHGLARNPTDLMICRFLFGFAYPGAYLAAAKIVAEWFPAKERALGTGVYTAGATVGATIAPPLIAGLYGWAGWRPVFFVVGGAGFVYLILWLIFYRTPEESTWLTDSERELILKDREKVGAAAKAPTIPITQVLSDRRFWAITLGRMLGDNPWVFYISWVPLYLNNEYHLSIKDIGLIGWIPFLFSDLGSLGGGWLSGVLVRRGWPVIKARLAIMSVSACVLALTFVLGLVSSTALIIGTLSLMMFCTMAWMVNLSTLPVDIFPQQVVGRVTALTSTGATVGQTLLTLVIGYCFTHHAYRQLFIMMSFTAPLALVVVRILLRPAGTEPAATAGAG
ncbi:MAG: MFS transporter [Opitutaceae bacterium]|nr:MFS transporter [Opitutaceae bacterium]